MSTSKGVDPTNVVRAAARRPESARRPRVGAGAGVVDQQLWKPVLGLLAGLVFVVGGGLVAHAATSDEPDLGTRKDCASIDQPAGRTAACYR